jgi:Na+-transporting methylmalonyl-CoA/oxaloacetate decarboxylase gamma subunit
VTWVTEWWNQVSGTVLHGFQITVVGMALVFLTLGLVIVAMVLLTRLPWLQARRQTRSQPAVAPEPAPAPLTSRPESPREDLAVIAAIAVAVVRDRHLVRRSAGASRTRSAWKHYGRAHQIGL